MQIVINIPDEEYKRWKEDGEMDAVIVRDALINGIPLPKKHGRLIDADDLYENTEICHSDIDGYACVRWKDINDAPTIVEADKAESEAEE